MFYKISVNIYKALSDRYKFDVDLDRYASSAELFKINRIRLVTAIMDHYWIFSYMINFIIGFNGKK